LISILHAGPPPVCGSIFQGGGLPFKGGRAGSVLNKNLKIGLSLACPQVSIFTKRVDFPSQVVVKVSFWNREMNIIYT